MEITTIRYEYALLKEEEAKKIGTVDFLAQGTGIRTRLISRTLNF